MTSRKQKALFRKSLNKIYPPTMLDNGEIFETSLHAFRRNRKTFKLRINPIKK